MEENIIQTNGDVTINIDVSVKNVMYVKKKIMFGILVHVLWMIQQLFVMKLYSHTMKK